ncbi:hypothetical protein K7K78_08525, partial [Enterococcus faecium]|nr:hypothetical protein [Enterococcus faecium]
MKSKKNKMISLCVGGLLNLLSCSVQTFSMKTRERRQVCPLFAFQYVALCQMMLVKRNLRIIWTEQKEENLF